LATPIYTIKAQITLTGYKYFFTLFSLLFLENVKVKEFENRSIFDDAYDKKLGGVSFSLAA